MDDEWRLDFRLLAIVDTQLERLELPAVARPALRQLAGTTGQTALLAVRSGNDVVYLDKVQTDAHVQLYVELGARRPLHSTALGKAILAFEPEVVREEFIRSAHLPAVTDRTITDAAALREQLTAFRHQGYATDNAEAVTGVSCLAVPLLDHAGHAVGAISIAGTDTRIGARAPEFVEAVRQAGEHAPQRLGHAAPRPTSAPRMPQ